MIERYPQFYWSRVEKYIGNALRYLEMTMEGTQWTATLYSHIFAIEHNRRRTGPQAGATTGGTVPLPVTGEIVGPCLAAALWCLWWSS